MIMQREEYVHKSNITNITVKATLCARAKIHQEKSY